MRTATRPRRRSPHDRGSATVEVAVALPVVMVLLVMVVQAGVYFHTRAVVTTAAHKGVDTARTEEGSLGQARSVTEAFLDRNAGGLESRRVDVTRTADRAEVTVAGEVTSLVFGLDIFQVRVTAGAPVERVTP